MPGMGARRARAARSPGMIRARRLFAAHEQGERTGVPVDEVLGRAGEADRRTRREVLVGAGGLAAGAALARSPAAALAFRIAKLQAHPRIAIVGAGPRRAFVARTCCGRRVPATPVASTVYEANADRAGGRCWTLRTSSPAALDHRARRFVPEQRPDRGPQARGSARPQAGGRQRRRPADRRRGVLHRRPPATRYAEANADWHDVGFPSVPEAARETAHRRRRQRGSTGCRCRSGWTAPRSARAAASAS